MLHRQLHSSAVGDELSRRVVARHRPYGWVVSSRGERAAALLRCDDNVGHAAADGEQRTLGQRVPQQGGVAVVFVQHDGRLTALALHADLLRSVGGQVHLAGRGGIAVIAQAAGNALHRLLLKRLYLYVVVRFGRGDVIFRPVAGQGDILLVHLSRCLRVGVSNSHVVAAHGRRHTQGELAAGILGGVGLLAAVKVLVLQHVGRARLLLGVAIQIVQRHAVAVRAVHSVPAGRQRLVAGGSQGDVAGGVGRTVVGVGDSRLRCRSVHRDPGELVLFDSSVAVQVGLYALHQHGGHVVVTRGGECAAGGDSPLIRTALDHAQIVIRPGTVLLRIQIEPHGVGFARLRVGDVGGGVLPTQVQLHAGQLRAGQELVRKVAARLDLPLAGGVAVSTQVDEQAFRGAAVLVIHHHLGHVRVLKLTARDIPDRVLPRFLQNEFALGRSDIVHHLIHAQLLLQFRHIAVLGSDEHTQLAVRRTVRRIVDGLRILAVEILCCQQCDAVLGYLIGADLQHGDAHLFAGLRVQTVGHLRRPHRGAHGPHALGAGPPAPVVLLDLLIQRPGIILPPQFDVAAEVVGDDVIDAVAGQDQRPLLGYAAVDAQVLPRVRGHILQHLFGGTARIFTNGDRGLRTQNEIHLGVDQLLAAQPPEAEAAQLLGYLHRCADAAPAVQVHMGVLGLGVVVQPAEYTGLDFGVQLKDRTDGGVVVGRGQLQPHAAARPQAGVFLTQILSLLAHQP